MCAVIDARGKVTIPIWAPDPMSVNGMVRPCSCPASKRSWQGGAKDKEHAMSQTPNTAIAVIGIDISKNSFHVVGHDARGAIVLRQKWSRGQVEARRDAGALRHQPLALREYVGIWMI